MCNTQKVKSKHPTLVCHKCGSGLQIGGYCKDETCPYHDYQQSVSIDSIYSDAPGTHFRREPIMATITSHCGRLKEEFDCSGYFTSIRGDHDLSHAIISEINTNRHVLTEHLQPMLQALRTELLRVEAFLRYCEFSVEAGLDKDGFHCEISVHDTTKILSALSA